MLERQMKKIFTLVMSIIFLCTGCSTTSALWNIGVRNVATLIDGYYISNDRSYLVASSQFYLFFAELNEKQKIFISDFLDKNSKIPPNIKNLIINKNGVFSAKIINNEMKTSINIKGNLLKVTNKSDYQLKKFKTPIEVDTTLPTGKGKNILKTLATPVTLTIDSSDTLISLIYATGSVIILLPLLPFWDGEF